MLNKYLRMVELLERTVLVCLFGLLVVLTGMQILLRNVFDTGMVWADDAIKVLVLWIAMAGALYATRSARHISIDVVTRFLNDTLQGVVKRILFLVAAAICALAAWHSYQFILLEYEDPTMAFLNVPSWLTQAVIPLTLLLMALRFLLLVVWLPATSDQDAELAITLSEQEESR